MGAGQADARIRCHQPLLHRQHQLVRRDQSRRGGHRVPATEPELEATDCLAQPLGQQALLGQAQLFDAVEELVGLGQETAASLFGWVERAGGRSLHVTA